MSGALVPVRRARRKGPAQVGNVVPLHAPKQTAEEVVREVQAEKEQKEQDISILLEDITRSLRQRHTERVRELLPIGQAMSASGLSDWLEIGRRMLKGGSGRR